MAIDSLTEGDLKPEGSVFRKLPLISLFSFSFIGYDIPLLMHESTRRHLLTSIAHASLGAAGLALLTVPKHGNRSQLASPMPPTIPPGWWLYRDHLIPNTKSGLLFRSKHQASAVYLGNGAVLTAAHNGPPPSAQDVEHLPFSYDGVRYRPDLLLYRIPERKHLSPLPIASIAPAPGSPLVHAGIGRHRSAGERFAPGMFQFVYTPEECKATKGDYFTPLFQFELLRNSPDMAPTACNVGDSGGPVFGYNPKERRWELVGLLCYKSESIGDGVHPSRLLALAIDLTNPLIRRSIVRYVDRQGS